MKTAELEGAALDYWVARAEVDAGNFTFDKKVANLPLISLLKSGLTSHVFSDGPVFFSGLPGEHVARGPSYGKWEPSSDWRFSGPIIEREKIKIAPCAGKPERLWNACLPFRDLNNFEFFYGPTPLIAAMRAFVASKFGDEVPDIKETA